MDESIILEAISSHIDHLEGLTSWLIPIFVLVFIKAFRGDKTIDILSIKGIKMENATLFIDTIVSFYALSVFMVVIRLHALFRQLSEEGAVTAFTQIATHEWLVNPFAFFGEGRWFFLNLLSVSAITFFYVACNDLGSFLRPRDWTSFNLKNMQIAKKLDLTVSLFNSMMGFAITTAIYTFYRLMANVISGKDAELASHIISASTYFLFVILLTVPLALYCDETVKEFLYNTASPDESEEQSNTPNNQFK